MTEHWKLKLVPLKNEPALNPSESISALIARFERGDISDLELAQRILQSVATTNGSVNPDLDRKRRTGFCEVIYGQGKSPDAIGRAVQSLLDVHPEVLVTRVSPEQVRTVSEWYPFTRWNHVGRTLRIARDTTPIAPEFVGRSADLKVEAQRGVVAVVSAGTTDEPVALEAIETLAWMGVATVLIQDIGVAGPYRLLARVPELQSMSAIVCVAGMEGALPSVLAGHVGCPVIAVPTSVGYGANFAGLSALLSMLNSCAANVAVVNIDAGFKGAYIAGMMVSRQFAGTDKSINAG